MKTVSFYNKGILDATSIATFGINAKDNDNAIGFFGTGLKYAIAVILRYECSIRIYAGDDIFDFTSVEKVVRGKSFKIIHMNGDPLGFTTELGKNWHLHTGHADETRELQNYLFNEIVSLGECILGEPV